MAKAHNLSFFSPFLVGFLMVLFLSDLTSVYGQSCYPQATVELGGGALCVMCGFQCGRVGGITFDSTTCGYNPETGNNVCICCING
ncbi:hypothetical protein MKX03_027188 [Papaver bracteatum]|nr:hypothetical protein MKX03_027188 [Papaver bracteatum]